MSGKPSEIVVVYKEKWRDNDEKRKREFYKVMPKAMFDIAHEHGAGFRQYAEAALQGDGVVETEDIIMYQKQNAMKKLDF